MDARALFGFVLDLLGLAELPPGIAARDLPATHRPQPSPVDGLCELFARRVPADELLPAFTELEALTATPPRGWRPTLLRLRKAAPGVYVELSRLLAGPLRRAAARDDRSGDEAGDTLGRLAAGTPPPAGPVAPHPLLTTPAVVRGAPQPQPYIVIATPL